VFLVAERFRLFLFEAHRHFSSRKTSRLRCASESLNSLTAAASAVRSSGAVTVPRYSNLCRNKLTAQSRSRRSGLRLRRVGDVGMGDLQGRPHSTTQVEKELAQLSAEAAIACELPCAYICALEARLETNRAKIVARLARDGWASRGGGRHDVFKHPMRAGRIIVPRHRTLSPGVARAIAKAAGWKEP
jgi:hypothetical protein